MLGFIIPESKQRGFSEGDNDLATRPPLQVSYVLLSLTT